VPHINADAAYKLASRLALWSRETFESANEEYFICTGGGIMEARRPVSPRSGSILNCHFLISESDKDLYVLTDDPDEAFRHITENLKNSH